jgi:hypothetical protein
MKQSSLKADSHLAEQNPPLDPVLNQMNAVLILMTCFIKIHFTIVLPS